MDDVKVIRRTLQQAALLVVWLLFVPSASFAQDSDLGYWFAYFGNKNLGTTWNWHHEAQYRSFNFLGDTEQLLLRTGMGYNLSENNNNLLTGIAYIYSEPYIGDSDEKTSFDEYRIYQQFITRQQYGRVSLQHRYRFEQRFFTEDFRLRLRYFLAATIALNHQQLQDNTVYLSAYNEIFIHTDGNHFDRNRLYFGLGYRFNRFIRSELGIMNQAVADSARNQINLLTFVNF